MVDCPRQALEETYPGILERLGVEPDSMVGDRYKLSRQEVHNLRTRLGVPSRTLEEPTPEIEEMLGTMPDTVLAFRLEVGTAAVKRWRQERDIPKWDLADL